MSGLISSSSGPINEHVFYVADKPANEKMLYTPEGGLVKSSSVAYSKNETDNGYSGVAKSSNSENQTVAYSSSNNTFLLFVFFLIIIFSIGVVYLAISIAKARQGRTEENN